MIYRSNLTAPDLSPYFRLLDPPKQIMGHDAPSDPDFEPDCTFWTHDEAAILYHIAKQVGGNWLDVGSRFGWTGAHIGKAGCTVSLVDPDYVLPDRWLRMSQGINFANVKYVFAEPFGHSSRYERYNGIVIDGCHDDPEPLNDAKMANHSMRGGVILLHDFMGSYVRDAARWLIDDGWRCRIYWTPNCIACCWRESCHHEVSKDFLWSSHQAQHDLRIIVEESHCMKCKATISRTSGAGVTAWSHFLPPDHVSDPRLAADFAAHRAQWGDFAEYWMRCE